MAIRSAKTLIDFTNIGIETEVLDMQGIKPGAPADNVEIELEEVIVFDGESHDGNRVGSPMNSRPSINHRSSNLLDPNKNSLSTDVIQTAAGSGSIHSNSKLRNMKERQKALKK